MLDQLVFHPHEVLKVVILRVLPAIAYFVELCCAIKQFLCGVSDASVAEHTDLHLLKIWQVDKSELSRNSPDLISAVPKLVSELLFLNELDDIF